MTHDPDHPLPCLRCYEPLDTEPSNTEDIDGVIRCKACGAAYSADLLANADRERWFFIGRNHLACFKCGLPSSAIVYTDHNGDPIGCYIHGANQ